MARRDPRQEAADRLGDRFDVRVLEPSPPAVTTGPWFADDPTEGGEIVPVDRSGARSWREVCSEQGDTALVTYCVERWLGPWRRLEALPAGFPATRDGLHSIAEHILAPSRHAATGRLGLRWTLGGFGTPYFGAGRQIRVERGELVDGDRRAPLTTLADAGRFLDVTPGLPASVYTPASPCVPDAPVPVDPDAAAALGDWFGFCTSVLEQLRAEAGAADAPSRTQLWPEHFDIAIDLGVADAGRRANFGGSPGDADHPEPYLYVGPWEPRQGPFWNEPFGASLPYAVILAAPDQRAAALGFLRAGLALLG